MTNGEQGETARPCTERTVSETSNQLDARLPNVAPIVTPIRVSTERGHRFVDVTCPYCGRKHHHGWGTSSDAAPGHRLAHCRGGGYYIAAPLAVNA